MRLEAVRFFQVKGVKQVRPAALIIAALVTIVHGAHGENWPTYRHDNHRSGVTPEKLDVRFLCQAWAYQPPSPPQPAWYGPARRDAFSYVEPLQSMRAYDNAFHVVVEGDQLYFGSTADDSVHALDVATGITRWERPTGGPVRNAPTCYANRVYAGSDDGYAYCLSAVDGQIVWKYRPEETPVRILCNGKFISPLPCRTGVLLAGDTALFGMSMLPWRHSYLCAVDAATGALTSPDHYAKRYDHMTMEAPFAESGGHLICPQGRVPPILFDRTDGRKLSQLKQGGGSFVLVTPDDRILHGPGNKQGWVNESRPDDPAKLVTHKNATMMLVAHGCSYLISDSRVKCLSRKDGKLQWQSRGQYPFCIIMAGNTLFAGGLDEVVALDAHTGERLWMGSVQGKALGLVAANGRLFVSTGEGYIHCFAQGHVAAEAVAMLEPARLPVAVDAWQHESLLDRWVFHATEVENGAVRNQAGRRPASCDGAPVEIVSAGSVEALLLDGSKRSIAVTDDLQLAGLPQRDMTAEAWVRVDKPLQWGGIIGALQDNGSYERGWLLGYCHARFCFAVAGAESNGRLTYLTDQNDFRTKGWYHVVGTYDGHHMKLYVDGKCVATSGVQRGDINYPPRVCYQMGSYRDDDEFFPMTGALQEVCLYRAALSDKEIQTRFESKRGHLPMAPPSQAPMTLAAGPWFQFTTPDSLTMQWETRRACPSELVWSGDGTTRVIRSESKSTDHEVTVETLRPDRLYTYSIRVSEGVLRHETKTYECDTFFNFAGARLEPQVPAGAVQPAALAGAALPGVPGGYGIAAVLGAVDDAFLIQLARCLQHKVVAIDANDGRIDGVRSRLVAARAYGTSLLAYGAEGMTGDDSPSGYADLVVALEGTSDAVDENVLRLLRPNGVAFLKGDVPSGAFRGAADVSPVLWQGAEWTRVTKAAGLGAGEWTHMYARPDNSGYGGETLRGATATTDLHVQWIGRPGPRFQADRSGRKPSPLVASGRMFVQGLGRILAMSAYNGTVQWSLEVPEFMRFNVPRDSSNWCADQDAVYLAVHDACWCIDAQAGTVRRRYTVVAVPGQEHAHDWGYIARHGRLLIGSAVRAGAGNRDYFGGAGWYDKPLGPSALKVCSDNLFALEHDTGRIVWTHEDGLIINSTITIGGDRLYFVACRAPEIIAAAGRRVEGDSFWQHQFLVALDAHTGTLAWARPLDTFDGRTLFVMAHGSGKLVVVSSAPSEYHVYTFDARTGEDGWQDSFKWPGDNHGRHMSRPAIIDGALVVRPAVFDLADGKRLEVNMPGAFRGCSSYAATSDALIYRDAGVTMWSPQTGKTSTWDRLRPDCWLSTIPACGLLLLPEAGGGCSCGSWMETSIAFTPRMSAGTLH